MPTGAAVGSMWQVVLRGKIEDQDYRNVLHFSCVGASVDVNVHLVLVLGACFIEHLLPQLCSSFTIQDLAWKQVAPALGVEQITVPPGAGAGGAAGDFLPSFNSVVISKLTPVGGRSHRGRMYMTGIPEAETTGSKVKNPGALWTAINDFVNCVKTNFNPPVDPAPPPNSFQLIVYSRKLGGSHFPYGTVGATSVTDLLPHVEIGTTRSRKVGRGS